MSKIKQPDPHKAPTAQEWAAMGPVMHGIDGLPEEAQLALKKAIGRPKSASPKKQITFRLDADVIARIQERKGYNQWAESILREAIEQGR